jgi:hypothetical protein
MAEPGLGGGMSTELQIEIIDPEADDERLATMTETLRQDLLALDVDSVKRVSGGTAPDGSKGIDPAAVGAILVALKSSVELASQVVAAVKSWMRRGDSKNETQVLKLTMNGQSIELSAASVDQQQQLVDAFVAAAANPQPTT